MHFWGKRYFLKKIDGIRMQSGFEKVLNFPQYLINIWCQLDFQTDALALWFPNKNAPRTFIIHYNKGIENDEFKTVLHHKSFSNHICVDLCLENVVFTYLTGFDGADQELFLHRKNLQQ